MMLRLNKQVRRQFGKGKGSKVCAPYSVTLWTDRQEHGDRREHRNAERIRGAWELRNRDYRAGRVSGTWGIREEKLRGMALKYQPHGVNSSKRTLGTMTRM